jgi:hypothetical protein
MPHTDLIICERIAISQCDFVESTTRRYEDAEVIAHMLDEFGSVRVEFRGPAGREAVIDSEERGVSHNGWETALFKCL